MRLLLSSLTAAALAGSAMVPVAQAAPFAGQSAVEQSADGLAAIEKTQYAWGGQNYCWYPDGWRGPGWYWCGYSWRRGFGWGGGYGWHGWHGGGGGWHGGGWHGGGWAWWWLARRAVAVGTAVAAAGMAVATVGASTAVAASMAAADMAVAATAVAATAAIVKPSPIFELAIGGVSRRFLLTARPASQSVRSKIR